MDGSGFVYLLLEWLLSYQVSISTNTNSMQSCLSSITTLLSSISMTTSPSSNPPSLTSPALDLLILGSGWTSTFLLPLLSTTDYSHITYISTTRSGSPTTLPFTFNPELEGDEANRKQFEGLPKAKTVVIIFPIRGEGGSKRLVEGYEGATGAKGVRWIQLGSTGIYDVSSFCCFNDVFLPDLTDFLFLLLNKRREDLLFDQLLLLL